ncbi:MAG: ABC transporter permease [Trueperaceae bacterium]
MSHASATTAARIAAASWRPHWATLACLAIALVGMFGPFAVAGIGTPPGPSGWAEAGPWILAMLALAAVAALHGGPWSLALVTPLALGVGFWAVTIQRALPEAGGWGYFATLAGSSFAAAVATGRLGMAAIEPGTAKPLLRLQRALPAATVPFLLLLAWEGLVVGNRVPKGIFPRVSDVATTLVSSWPVLMADAYLTFVQEVLFGFAVGLTTGFLVGAAIAFSRFLKRGFLPLATAFGAVPIVGLAPVLGRALGVDWESKAAVVVIVTFFPVVLNTVQGLTLVDPLRLELLRSYAAKPLEVFLKLRLPNALPYVFNALKVSVVVAIISVIVAEFLIPGPPNGLGQRISLSAHRGAFDVVFAAILVSSVISMALYWAISLLERAFTSWHPSSRGS